MLIMKGSTMKHKKPLLSFVITAAMLLATPMTVFAKGDIDAAAGITPITVGKLKHIIGTGPVNFVDEQGKSTAIAGSGIESSISKELGHIYNCNQCLVQPNFDITANKELIQQLEIELGHTKDKDITLKTVARTPQGLDLGITQSELAGKQAAQNSNTLYFRVINQGLEVSKFPLH